IASFSTNESLLSFLQNIEIINGHVNDSSSSVCITTIHAAKGLEWDYVFIPGLEEGILPHYRADDKKKREEEKRLLFVACTRARKKLYLLRCKYRYRNEKKYSNHPSKFLNELSKEDI